ncbi:hypothetical protein K435DRAFT_869920 [Dendrothele bispora CBS 962.96]|uniref:Retrotransposon Copia-like N-terminal domain-containing protein n=1 Tax=Dendrothele bispora (strain CBS 962.96) TaxID=1314807 RepID=A0A4S8L7U7_DENBC|nr:hypothetical protein K435DRAFT_869920 [Dendrothele bispora CBS 962.96]
MASAIGHSNNFTSIQELPDDEKFNGENFISWKESILRYGRLKGLDLYWEGKVSRPTMSGITVNLAATVVNDPNPNELEYPIRESVAYLTLWSNIKSPNTLGLGSKKTSHDLWTHLEDEYTGGGITGDGGYAKKIRSLFKDAQDAGASISDEQLITLFVDSFPRSPEWLPILASLADESNFNITANKLQEFVRLMSGSDGGGIEGMDKVSVLQSEVKQLKEQIVAMQAKKGPANPNLKCTNPNCNRVGHTVENCFRKGGGKEGQYPSWWKGKRENSTNATTSAANASASSSSIQTVSAHTTVSEDSDTEPTFFAMNTSATTPVQLPFPVRILADSGASNHFFKERSAFATYTPQNFEELHLERVLDLKS